ncbi:reverse transcriptase, partial [Lasius niger]
MHLSRVGPDLAESQFGFREGCSTIDVIRRVRFLSEESAYRSGVALAVSLDIVNAFNTLPWESIGRALEFHRVPAYLRRIVGAYLRDRWIEYPGRFRATHRRKMYCGVLQESVLGPILWDLAYDAVLRAALLSRLSVACYTDDTLVLARGKDWGKPGTSQRRWCFDKHFDRLASRVEEVAAALGRLLLNLGDPGDGVRCLYASVVQAVALYGAPRRMAIRVAREYRTISHEAANVLAGTPPMDLLAEMHMTIYDRRKALRRDGVTLSKWAVERQRRQARQSIVREWRGRLDDPSLAGHWTVGAVRPCFEAWLDRGWGRLTYRLTQVLFGHRCFEEYLCRIRKESTSQCHHYGAGRDTALHTLEECPAEERRVLTDTIGGDLSLPTVVRAMVDSERSWNAMASFCERVMLRKEAAERDRERGPNSADR